jgi:hypothetical protein
MPEVDSKVAFMKESIKDFLDFLTERARKERALTTDTGCRRALDEMINETEYQRKLFGII